MTNDNKHEDNDRKKVSDEEMEDVVGGLMAVVIIGGHAIVDSGLGGDGEGQEFHAGIPSCPELN